MCVQAVSVLLSVSGNFYGMEITDEMLVEARGREMEGQTV
jgi:hypothetical protein